LAFPENTFYLLKNKERRPKPPFPMTTDR